MKNPEYKLLSTRSVKLKQLKRILYFSLFFLPCTCTFNMASERLSVFVTIEPQRFFVEQIGGGLVDCRVMVPPGADAHTYEPKPGQMAALSGAKIYFAIGIEFEDAHLDKIISINPAIKVINTDEGIKKIPMESHHHEGDHHEDADDKHGHETDNEANHKHLDPHIWLSPLLVKIQAAAILKALNETDPAHKNEYESNYKKFISRIEQLDGELKNLFNDKSGMKFIVFHPAWGYFANAYNLVQVPVEVEGKEPKPAQLKN
jgi:zinc transport system substrate-binding protein